MSETLTDVSSSWNPATYTVEDLATELGYTHDALSRLAARIDKQGYSQFVSRRGKTRVISEPALWLGSIQRTLVDGVFSRIPVSDRVFSQRGRDALQHAREHVGNPYMVVLDIRDCFPSITVGMVRDGFLRAGFSHHVAHTLTRLVTHNGRLPQGSRASSAVLDCVFRQTDDELTCLAASHGAVYSRFADDLAFSGAQPLGGLRRRAVRALARRGLQVNHNKLFTWGPKDRKKIAQVIVADRLYVDSAFLHELDRAIATFGSARATHSATSIAGKISWVERVNADQGATYRKRFRSLRDAG